jgi:hypothetical protein
MTANPRKFKYLLGKAINEIFIIEGTKTRLAIQDELGYAANRPGGRTAIDYWRREGGHIPDRAAVEGLAREIARRKGLARAEMLEFLLSAAHPAAQEFCNQLYPNAAPPPPVIVLESAAAATIEPAGPTLTSPPAPEHFLPFGQRPPAFRRRTPKIYWRMLLIPFGLSLGLVWLLTWLAPPIRTPAFNADNVIPGEMLLVEGKGGSVHSGDTIGVGELVTASFKVVNSGFIPVTFSALEIGSHGPGVGCDDVNAAKWNAPNAPFPSIHDLTLYPGNSYTYRGARAFSQPGKYFLEPVILGTNGIWGGLFPYPCVTIFVEDALKK